ncbi:serine/arginine repetitive matrix protein 1 [Manduca sexta]|uniref:serine/arginine repetitive matrix protein 1 n=1 Tax=Manduca sexta TaxID=7130 RepID=UPI00188ED198|nr:serine/arginine repetitive matrix protein 1 [Manduca sexta]
MGCDGMEPDDDKTKKLNEDFVEFMRKRSDTEAPRYTARLKTYVDFKRKRDRATAARRNYESGHHDKTLAAGRKKADDEQKDKGLENNDHTGGDKERISRRRDGDKLMPRGRSFSRSRSGEPSDRCGRRRRRRRRSSPAPPPPQLPPPQTPPPQLPPPPQSPPPPSQLLSPQTPPSLSSPSLSPRLAQN